MIIPYRAGRVLRRLFLTLLILALLAGAGLLCWFLWLGRYVVYTREGAKLDFGISLEYAPGQTAAAPVPIPTVEIIYGEATEPQEETVKGLTRFSGYYVTLKELTSDFDTVQERLEKLPAGSTVMLDVKNAQSYFYYTSSLGFPAPKFDTTRLDGLIKELKARGDYLIARLPAFQEYEYILEDEWGRVPYGLPIKGGNGSLWLDTAYPCYWMNPASEGTLTYLMQIITELRIMGFNEVVFSEFRFPDTDKIGFEGDKMAALNAAAATLVNACATDSFCVSFIRSAPDLTLPAERTRLYLEGVAAADAAALAAQAGFADSSVHVVFLTDTNDTRYDQFCALRPLETAH